MQPLRLLLLTARLVDWISKETEKFCGGFLSFQNSIQTLMVNGALVKIKLVTGDESNPIGNIIRIVAIALSLEVREVANT